MHITSLRRPATQTVSRRIFGSELSATFKPSQDESLDAMFRRLADTLEGAVILNLLVFGDTRIATAANTAMKMAFGRVDWPITWVEGSSCEGNGLSGVQVFALIKGNVQRIRLNGKVVGSVFSDGDVRHCMLGGLAPVKKSASREAQTKQALERFQAALEEGGFSIGDTIRTWFFLEDILSWYHEFNEARTAVYSGIKFATGSLPASTGVGGRNPAGAALTMAGWAMRPLGRAQIAKEIASPLQCPAPAYGSSFSRAMEISSSAGRRVLISGTASIAPEGETLHKEDAHKQIELTMKVVEAILQPRGLRLRDLAHVTAYFKRLGDAGTFASWWKSHGLSGLPAVLAQCDICRNDLLFEIEADASRVS